MAIAPVTPEGVQLVLYALKYGGLAMATGALTQAGADAYTALVNRLRAIFMGRRDGNLVLDRYVEDSKTWAPPLEKELQETGAFSDPEVERAARQVMAVVGSQIAAGKFNVQMGPGSQIGQVIQGETVYVSPPGTATAPTRVEKPMGMKAFNELVKPTLIREGWEVSFTTREKLDLKRVDEWEEVFEQAPDGSREMIVITVNGTVDSIPVRRNKLSPNAIKLLIAALQHGSARPHSLWFKEYIGPDSPRFGVEDVHVYGADAEYAREELLSFDLISERSQGYYLLTVRGRKRAEELKSVGHSIA
jgi:hypothetical protein